VTSPGLSLVTADRGRLCASARHQILLPLLLPNSRARDRTGRYEHLAADAAKAENVDQVRVGDTSANGRDTGTGIVGGVFAFLVVWWFGDPPW
jgi:hypothetical protein